MSLFFPCLGRLRLSLVQGRRREMYQVVALHGKSNKNVYQYYGYEWRRLRFKFKFDDLHVNIHTRFAVGESGKSLGWEFKLELARPANVQAGDIKLRLRVRPAFKARRTRVDASIVENFIPPRQSNAMSRKTKPKTHVSFVGGSRGLFCYNTPFPSHPPKIKTTQHGSALPKL